MKEFTHNFITYEALCYSASFNSIGVVSSATIVVEFGYRQEQCFHIVPALGLKEFKNMFVIQIRKVSVQSYCSSDHTKALHTRGHVQSLELL